MFKRYKQVKMSSKNQVWGKYELKTEDAWQFTGGEAVVSVKRLPYGWMIEQATVTEKSDAITFKRLSSSPPTGNENIYQTGRSEILHVLPSLPVKPVVLRNNKTIKITPKQSIKLFLAVPINVQLFYSLTDQEHVITEMAMEKLSDTWFGEADSGEPAFSIGQGSSLTPEELNIKNYEALCPVKITNSSNHLLELERLIIRVENMAIYIKNNQLITSRALIDFKGTDQTSNLDFSTDKKIHGDHPVLVSKARNAGVKSILGKSFHFIKHFTQ